MASVELNAEHLVIASEMRDGRWALVLKDANGGEAVVKLPRDDPHWTARRIGMGVEEQAWEIRDQVIAGAHRGGMVIVTTAPEDGNKGWLSGAC